MEKNNADYRLRIRNVRQLVTVCSEGELFKTGQDMDKVSLPFPSLSLSLDTSLVDCVLLFTYPLENSRQLQVTIINNGTLIVDNDGVIAAVSTSVARRLFLRFSDWAVNRT